MGLSWSDPKLIGGDASRYPYTHWWREHEAATDQDRAIDARQRPAFRAFADMQKFRVNRNPGRATDIIANFPFAEAVPALLELRAINPSPAEDFIRLDPGRGGLAPGDVILAAIDDGAFFAHQLLQRPGNELQVDWVWLQGAPVGGPSELVCGRELQREEIDELIARYRRGDIVDEDSLYREVGLVDMAAPVPQSAAQRTSHGMAVVDLLTGPGAMFRPGWPDRSGPDPVGTAHVLWVSLPPRVTHDTSGTFIPFFVLLALHALMKRIEALLEDHPGLQIPVAVNMSYGLTAGPKDGRGSLAQYVDERVAQWNPGGVRPSLFLPAGNTRLTQSRARLGAEGEGPLYWHLPPDDPTPSFAEIWGPEMDARPARPALRIAITPPGEMAPLTSPELPKFGSFSDLMMEGLGVAMRAYARWVPTNPDPMNPDSSQAPGPGRECLVLAAQPTRPSGPGRTFLRPGRWRIAPSGQGDTPVDIYVQRDDSLPGYPRRGRQSWLEDNVYRRRDPSGRLILNDPARPGPVRRDGTFNALAAGDETRIVAGLRRRGPEDSLEGAPDAAFSALGRRDARGWAEGRPAWPWLTVAGARSGSRVQVRGTSFASPQAARAEALGRASASDGPAAPNA